MHEIHKGVCGTHASGHVMARQIMRAEYYWMTLENDCINYVRKCHKCQIYTDKIHVPPTSLNVMVSPWPFSMWGMDVIGAYNPEGLERSSLHFCSHRLLYQMGRGSVICQYNKVNGSLIHQERNHMSIRTSKENYI